MSSILQADLEYAIEFGQVEFIICATKLTKVTETMVLLWYRKTIYMIFSLSIP